MLSKQLGPPLYDRLVLPIASPSVQEIQDYMVVASWLQIAIALRVDKKLEGGSADGIFQIGGEEVQPGERQ